MSPIAVNDPFANLFDITSNDIDSLIIKENSRKDNCIIYDSNIIVGGFILINKPSVKTILKVTFFKSTTDNKYLPRLEFRKQDNQGNLKLSRRNDVIINFGQGDEARAFWKVIHFLQGFKDLVDLGDFHSKYQAVSFDS
ncbi:MAG: hypothetical protein ABJQ96_18785, partial [Crocinitomicaceae bacterium]